MSILSLSCRFVVPAEVDRDHLHSVADTEDRSADFVVKTFFDARCVLIGHARRPAGEDHAFRRLRRDRLSGQMKRMDLAIDALLAYAPCDQLRILGSEI